jgi:hypothetical protein
MWRVLIVSNDLLEKLKAPFDPKVIEWRVGPMTRDKTKCQALAYIDSRTVQERLDEVCGLNWQTRYPWSADRKTCCEIGIKIGEEWIWRSDGAGDTDMEGSKGAFSDAFKRAAVKWGIGRYLYEMEAPWVFAQPKGKSWIIDPSERDRLQFIAGGGKGKFEAPPGLRKQTPDQAPQVPSYNLLRQAHLETARGYRAFKQWYDADLNDEQRLELRPHIANLAQNAREVDRKKKAEEPAEAAA